MKKKIDTARSSAERDLTISTTKQIEALWNGHEAGEFQRSRIDGRCSSHQARRSGVCAGVLHLLSHPTSLMFSPALLKCYVRQRGTD